jgi:hypothetical protein
MAVINLNNGSRIRTFPPPPEGSAFDPLKASNIQLVRHGFPPRPENPELLARFQRHFTRMKGKLRYIEPTFSLRPSMKASAGPHGVGGGSTKIWSGAVIYAPSGESFKWVEAEWIIPNVSEPVTGNTSTCLSWVGLGNSSLLQAGAGCQFDPAGTPSFFLWHEWLPPGWVTINNLAAQAGDLITVVICTPSGAGSTSSTIYFSNCTSGHSTSYELSFPQGPNDPTSFPGDQAEWIVELSTNGTDEAQVPDYGQVFFSSANAGLENGSLLNAASPGSKGNLTNGSIDLVINGTTLSTGAVLTPTVVQCQYTGPEPYGNQPGLVPGVT